MFPKRGKLVATLYLGFGSSRADLEFGALSIGSFLPALFNVYGAIPISGALRYNGPAIRTRETETVYLTR